MPSTRRLSSRQFQLALEKFAKDPNDKVAVNLMRELCKRNLYFLNKFVLGYKDMHKDLHDDLCSWAYDNRKKNYLALLPRGHFKSTMLTIGQTIQEVLINPEITILLINITHDKCKKFLHEIKGHFETNTMLRNLFPDIIPKDAGQAETWTNDKITVLRSRPKASATIETAGVDSKVTGSHYDIQIYDDVINEDTVKTKEQIQQTWNFFDMSMYLLNPGGEIRIIGTRYHFDDFYQQCMDRFSDDIKAGKFVVKERRALEGKNVNRYIKYVLNSGNDEKDQEYTDKESIWQDKTIFPSKWTKTELKRFRVGNEANFWNQMMNFPIDPEEQVFKRHFTRYWRPGSIPTGSFRYITVDPSVGQSERADKTAIIDCMVDWEKKWYLTNYVYEVLNEHEIINAIIDLYIEGDYEVRALGIEADGFQKNLKNGFEEECKKRGLNIHVVELNTHGRSKPSRIRALQWFHENEFILYDPKFKPILEAEVYRYPNGRNDDFLDSEAYLLDMTQDWGYPSKPAIIDSNWRKAYAERGKRSRMGGVYETEGIGSIMRG